MSEKPVHPRSRRLADWINPTGAKLDSFLRLHRLGSSLRESCIRENRTCSLSGGRRPARKRASSDPTAGKRVMTVERRGRNADLLG